MMTEQQLRAVAVQAVASAAGKEMFVLDESDRGVNFDEINPEYWSAVRQLVKFVRNGETP